MSRALHDGKFPELPATRSAMIANELRSLIQRGELAPGSRLRQTELAARFGVSITPVREALTSLARDGLVVQDPHRGAVVFAPNLDDLLENYEIRGRLEPLATELATPQLTEQDLGVLDDLLGRMGGEHDPQRYHDLNREFHATVYRAANRPRLFALIESLRDASEAYLRLNAAGPPSNEYQKQVRAEHEAIARMLRNRQAKRAAKLMQDHLTHNLRQLETVLQPAPVANALSKGDERSSPRPGGDVRRSRSRRRSPM